MAWPSPGHPVQVSAAARASQPHPLYGSPVLPLLSPWQVPCRHRSQKGDGVAERGYRWQWLAGGTGLTANEK